MRVFDRFRKLSESEMKFIRDSKETDSLKRSLENYQLTLGDMLNEFRYWDRPRSGASRQFRGWLERENPGLVPSLKKIDLKRPVDLHNAAKHPSERPLEWNDAEDMARLSRGLLSAVIEHERGGPVEMK